jgi:hypothetical protein
MQTLTERIFELAPPGGLFNESVVRNVLPETTTGARKQLVYRAIEHGEILRLKPGDYCLATGFRKSHPHPFVLAAVLHSPSHVSLESALSFHGLIPEAVYAVSSVTYQRSRSFKTPWGLFSFQRVPTHQPRAGVEIVRLADDAWAFVARPLRAIADLVYLRKEVCWESAGSSFLTESMRIEEDDLEEMSMDDFDAVHESLKDKRVKAYLCGLAKEISR